MSEPAITRRAANDSGADNLPVNRIVIHCTCGGRGYAHESEVGVAANTAAYFSRPTTQASAHYIEDIEDEQHCVPDDVIAWHAPPNKGSIGIEICGEASYNREEWLSPEVWPAVEKAAARARELAARFDVPLVRLNADDLLKGWRGVCGHVDVSEAWHESDHTDPGPDFPWDAFMALLGPEPAPGAPAPDPAPAPAPAPPAPAEGDMVYGERSERVRHLQEDMTRVFPSYNQYTPTGFYGDLTTRGLAEFQFRVGIVGGDGQNVGPLTRAALARFGITAPR